jgi:hypothetical protein
MPAKERPGKIGEGMDHHHNMAVARMPSSYDRLFQAFDIAWPRLLPSITDRGLANDIARRKLADTVLLFEGDDRSATEIAKAALRKLFI